MISLDTIKDNEERFRQEHSRFLRNLSTGLLPRLFSEVGVMDYEVVQKFLEPTGNPPSEEVSPDLVVYYSSPSSASNLLIVEAKLHVSHTAREKLDNTLVYFRHFVDSHEGQESLHYILEGALPMETLASCRVTSAVVFGTKQGGFKLYRSERLR